VFGTIAADGVAATNLTIDPALGVNVAAGDVVWTLTTQAYAAGYPTFVGDSSLILDVSTGLAAGDRVVVVASPYTWVATIAAAATTNTIYTLTLGASPAAVVPPGGRIYALTTNIYTTQFAETAEDSELVLNNSTGLAAGERAVVLPSTGGTFVREIGSIANRVHQSQNLKAETGVALAAGDRVFVLGTAVTTPVTATTVRLFGDPIRVLPVNVPGVLSVDGTSACSINTATVKY
jgi:hypothetical protein